MEEEESRDKDKEEDRDEGDTTSGDEIDGPNEDAERDDNVSVGTSMSIGTLSGEVAVLRLTNRRAAESKGTRMKSRLIRRKIRRRQSRNIYRSRIHRRRGSGSRTSHKRQQSFCCLRQF